MAYNYSKGWSTKDLDDMSHYISTFKKAVWALIRPHCDHGLTTLKFHLLDYHFAYLEHFWTMHVQSPSPYEHYNFVVKQAYNSTSKRLHTRTSDTVNNLNSTLKKQRVSDVCNVQQPSPSALSRKCLMQHGKYVCFQSLLAITDNLFAIHFAPNRFLRALYNSLKSDEFS